MAIRNDDQMDLDPDAPFEVPRRELVATVALLRALVTTVDAGPALAEQLIQRLADEQSDPQALLPEVGRVGDSEGLRLHLHRLHDRLVEAVEPLGASLPFPPVMAPERLAGRELRKPSRSAAVIDDDLASAFVWWDDITKFDLAAYRDVLDAAEDERPLQRHLAANPRLLVQHLRGGHGRWVLSQKRLGSEYIPDFAIAQRSSSGTEWQFVELQSPHAALFLPSSGRQSRQFDEGLRQLSEWRRWVAANRDYARRSRAEQGLGLREVTSDDQGLLLIGREERLTEDDRQRRRQLERLYNVRIHTYDWLAREAASRLNDLDRSTRHRLNPR